MGYDGNSVHLQQLAKRVRTSLQALSITKAPIGKAHATAGGTRDDRVEIRPMEMRLSDGRIATYEVIAGTRCCPSSAVPWRCATSKPSVSEGVAPVL